MSYFSEPPYFLLVAGLLVALTCGTALQQRLNKVQKSARASKANAKLQIGGLLLVPFLGICAGVCIFLSSGLEIFGFPAMLSMQLLYH